MTTSFPIHNKHLTLDSRTQTRTNGEWTFEVMLCDVIGSF